MEGKVCFVGKIGKCSDIFTINIENVNPVIFKEVQDVILKTKINYQINRKYIIQEIEMSYLLNQKKIDKTENLMHNKQKILTKK